METAPISKTKAYTLVKVIEKSRGTVELKEDVNTVIEEEKIGADEIARRKAEEEAREAEATAETSADESSDEGEEK